MNDWPGPRESETYRYHWLSYWRALSIIALLIVLGSAAILASPTMGLILWVLALAGLVSVWLRRTWHSLYFTPDGRLIRRRGILGCTHNIITLFGVITPYQMPLVGHWLDVGSVHMGIPGPDEHIRHISPFAQFYRRLVYGAQQQEERNDRPSVQVFVQYPGLPVPWADPSDFLHPGRADQLRAGRAGPDDLG